MNNAALCDLVCRSHEVRTTFGTRVWAATERPPPFYPDAVTLVPGVEPREALRSVRDGPGCAVKDSFAALALHRRGFEELFEARWIFRDPVAATERPEGWAAIETEEALAAGLRPPAFPRSSDPSFSRIRRCAFCPATTGQSAAS